jgi:hypothetical protein
MKMQVSAKVIVAKTLFEIQKRVNELIAEGWILQGAVTPVYKEGHLSYLATLVKEV